MKEIEENHSRLPGGLSYAAQGTTACNNTFILKPELHKSSSPGSSIGAYGFLGADLKHDSFYVFFFFLSLCITAYLYF